MRLQPTPNPSLPVVPVRKSSDDGFRERRHHNSNLRRPCSRSSGCLWRSSRPADAGRTGSRSSSWLRACAKMGATGFLVWSGRSSVPAPVLSGSAAAGFAGRRSAGIGPLGLARLTNRRLRGIETNLRFDRNGYVRLDAVKACGFEFVEGARDATVPMFGGVLGFLRNRLVADDVRDGDGAPSARSFPRRDRLDWPRVALGASGGGSARVPGPKLRYGTRPPGNVSGAGGPAAAPRFGSREISTSGANPDRRATR